VVAAGVVAAEVVAGVAAAVVAVSALAAEAAAAAAADSVASGTVAARAAPLARVAADPGERAACAKSHESTVVTVGGSPPIYPNDQTDSVTAVSSRRCTKAAS
jgi:hypothetical protein